MMILITYDVNTSTAQGRKRLRNIAKVCVDYGIRVQYSVFECEVDPAQWTMLKNLLLEIFDPAQDSLRFYKLGSHWRHRVEHHGAKPATDLFGDILVL